MALPLLLLLCGSRLAAVRQQSADVRTLSPSQPITSELQDGAPHNYQITLADGMYLEVWLEQRGIDAALVLSAPERRQLSEVNRARGLNGQEQLTFVANAAGNYWLEIRAGEKNAAPGHYELRIETLRAATAEERTLDEARQLAENANELRKQAKYKDALPLAQRGLLIREQMLGKNHLLVAESLYGLASIYDEQEDYAQAEPLFQRSLTIREALLGAEHTAVARSLISLAWIYSTKQNFEKAEAFYQRALGIQERALGLVHSEIATTLNDLALLYEEKGDYDQAIRTNQRVLAIREKTQGVESDGVARVLNNLGLTYQSKGSYAEAEPALRGSLQIWEKIWGPEHPQVLFAVANLAGNRLFQGDFLEAEQLFQRALAGREKALGTTHPRVAQSVNNLGLLYLNKGDYTKAGEHFGRAIAIFEKQGKESPDLSVARMNLAECLLKLKDYARAESLLRPALAFYEKNYGPEHRETAAVLNLLGSLYWQAKQDDAQAEVCFRRALTILEKALGNEQAPVVQSLIGLARLEESRGRLQSAMQFYQRALTIQEKALGPEHPNVAKTLNDLARLAREQEDNEQALSLLSRVNEIRERNYNLNLPLGSERHQQTYLQLFAADTDRALSLHAQAMPRDERALRLALTTLLRRKGRGLETMSGNIAALRASLAPPEQQVFKQLADARARLAALTLRQLEKFAPSYRTQLAQLEAEVDRLEAELSTRSLAYRAQSRAITLTAVQAALPAQATLLEIALYRPEKNAAPRYVAYLLSAQGAPQWADLGTAAALDEAIRAWRAALREPKRTDVRKLGNAVSALLLKPLQPLLGETRHLLISPDGALNLIPFEALPVDSNHYLVERYAVSYLTSGRDLLRWQETRPSQQPPLVIADPLFGEAGAADAATKAIALRRRSVTTGNDLNETYFAPLFATAQEARAIKSLFTDATVWSGAQATEAALKQAAAPRLLHIATHGFFLNNGAAPSADAVNPLLRSGLALAQANRHAAHMTGEDGILTALEATGLNLWGTQLVTLSACDTGLGEVRNGEGVYGLRRAFTLAGAETLVMSLWPVGDQVTRELMTAFYTNLQRGQMRGAALRAAQLHLLKRPDRRAPYYWASFIQAGQWGDLNLPR